MHLEIKDLHGLAKVQDGVLNVLIAKALEQVNLDLIDRPGVATARKIILEISAVPKADQSGALAGIQVAFEVRTKGPAHRTRDFDMGCTGDGFVYNDVSPGNRNQRTLDEEAERNTNGAENGDD